MDESRTANLDPRRKLDAPAPKQTPGDLFGTFGKLGGFDGDAREVMGPGPAASGRPNGGLGPNSRAW
jgi:hypothetical protein